MFGAPPLPGLTQIFDAVGDFVDAARQEPAPFRQEIAFDPSGILSALRTEASSLRIEPLAALARTAAQATAGFFSFRIPDNGPFTGHVLASYSAEHPFKPPISLFSTMPTRWLVARVPVLHSMLPNPADYARDGNIMQQYMHWISMMPYYQVGVFLPSDLSSFGSPAAGDDVSVSYANARNLTGGRYTPTSPTAENAPSSLVDIPRCDPQNMLISIPFDDSGNQSSRGRDGSRSAGGSANFSIRDDDALVTNIVVHSTVFGELGRGSGGYTEDGGLNMLELCDDSHDDCVVRRRGSGNRVGYRGMHPALGFNYWVTSDKSTHFMIHLDGTIVQYLDPFLFRAWHAASFNGFSVGVDLIGDPGHSRKPHTQRQVEALSRLVNTNELSGLTITGHGFQVDTSHSDPGLLVGPVDSGEPGFWPWDQEPFASRTLRSIREGNSRSHFLRKDNRELQELYEALQDRPSTGQSLSSVVTVDFTEQYLNHQEEYRGFDRSRVTPSTTPGDPPVDGGEGPHESDVST